MSSFLSQEKYSKSVSLNRETERSRNEPPHNYVILFVFCTTYQQNCVILMQRLYLKN